MTTIMATAGALASRNRHAGEHALSVTSGERAMRADVERVLDAAAGRMPRDEDEAVSLMTSTDAAVRRIAATQHLPLTAVRGRVRQTADLLRAETTAASVTRGSRKPPRD